MAIPIVIEPCEGVGAKVETSAQPYQAKLGPALGAILKDAIPRRGVNPHKPLGRPEAHSGAFVSEELKIDYANVGHQSLGPSNPRRHEGK